MRRSEAGERTLALDEATISVLLDWRAVQERERSAAGPEVWVDSGRVFTHEDGARLRPQWISTRFKDLIKKYALVQDKHCVEGWAIDRIARHHRISVRTVQVATGGEPLPPIRFHALRHGAATLALLGNVNMKVISETLGHAATRSPPTPPLGASRGVPGSRRGGGRGRPSSDAAEHT